MEVKKVLELIEKNEGDFKIKIKNDELIIFNLDGNIIYKEDSAGNYSLFEYFPISGKPYKRVDYNKDGNVIMFSLNDGTYTIYEYDNQGFINNKLRGNILSW